MTNNELTVVTARFSTKSVFQENKSRNKSCVIWLDGQRLA